MITRDIGWLWAASIRVCGQRSGITPTYHRIKFLLKSLAAYSAIRPLIDATPESALGELIRHRPETIGAAMWPYQCSAWDARTRLGRIFDHYTTLEKIGGVLDFPLDEKIFLLDLNEIHPELHVVLDHPPWFLREGQLAVNLFLADVRVYTLAFSLHSHGSKIAACVGAVQGRDIESVVEVYRELTKESHGIHPRNLLIKIFQMLCAELGITEIFAVSEEYRAARDREYFGEAHDDKLHTNYNEIWAERGGVRIDSRFYQLDVGNKERDLASMSSTKRKKYRKRINLLREIEHQIHHRCIMTILSDAGLDRTTEEQFSV